MNIYSNQEFPKMKTIFSSNPSLESLIPQYRTLYIQKITLELQEDRLAQNGPSRLDDSSEMGDISLSPHSPTRSSSGNSKPYSVSNVSALVDLFLQEYLLSENLRSSLKQKLFPKFEKAAGKLYEDMMEEIATLGKNLQLELDAIIAKMKSLCTNDSESIHLREVLKVINDECKEKVLDNEKKELELKDKNPSLQRDMATHYSYQALLALRTENYIQAIKDTTKAISFDNQYTKAYHRRAAAYISMRKFEDAVNDFQKILEITPDDDVAKKKLDLCKQELKRIHYQKSILYTPTTPSENIRLGQVFDVAIAKAEGESMEDVGITIEFIHEMIQRFKKQKKIQKKYALYMLVRAINIFKSYESVYDVNVPDDKIITICGDVHGQFYDLCRIFELNGYPSKDNPYIFNGDFVDRGSFSCEVIFTLLAFKVLDPDCIHMTRGNHEDREMNRGFGFEGEVKHKYSSEIFEIFQECFNWLPLGIVLNKRIFIVHGGVAFDRDVTIDELRKIDRFRPCPEDGLMCHMLWSDPAPENEWPNLVNGLSPSDRGVSYFFGPKVLNRFLIVNNLDLVIRSHELKDEGYEIQFDRRLITVFSAPNYVDYSQNKGAFIVFRGSNLNNRQQALVPKFCKFSHSQHPPIRAMAYANMLYQSDGT